MAGLSLGLGMSLSRRIASIVAPGLWLLLGGTWNDSGVWDDASTWVD